MGPLFLLSTLGVTVLLLIDSALGVAWNGPRQVL
jgi:hypothetical protein